MSSFLLSVGLTVIVIAAIVGIRWYKYPRDKGFGAIPYMMEFAPIMTCAFFVCAFGGPIIKAGGGYWFRRPQRNE